MKNKLLLFVFIIIAVFNFECKKHLFDYRKNYVGDYNFVVYSDTWSILAYSIPQKDTTYYTGNVYYGDKNEIGINFNPYTSVVLIIDKAGNLNSACSNANVGRFNNKNTVMFKYSTHDCPGGGLGGGTDYQVTGTRK